MKFFLEYFTCLLYIEPYRKCVLAGRIYQCIFQIGIRFVSERCDKKTVLKFKVLDS